MGFQVAFESENVKCQQVESSRSMEQQQEKHDGPVRCVCEERRAAEHRKSAEPEVVHGFAELAEIRWSGCGPHLVSVAQSSLSVTRVHVFASLTY